MPKTLKDLIPVLRDTYRSIDIRAVLAKSKAESIWYSVVLKVLLTKDSRTELKQTQETKQSKLGTIKREKFRVVFENKDVQQLESVLSEIKNGCLTLNGDRTKLVGADFQNIFQKDIVNDQLYTTPDQRSGNTHKMVFTAMPENPESFTRNILQVTEEEQGIKFSEIYSWLDATPASLVNPNNVLLIFPIYCKRLTLTSDEKGKFLTKYSIHRLLLSECLVKVKIFRNENIVERPEFQMKEYIQSPYEDMATIRLPMTQTMLPIDYLELEVVHKSLEGIGLSCDTVYGSEISDKSERSRKVEKTKFPLFSAFNHFRAGKNFADYILSYDNKKQEVSTTWLLALLDFVPVRLGAVDKNDEKMCHEDRYAADIIAYTTNNEISSLVVDCTTSVPPNDAIDKIRNTANQINLKIGITFVPTIFSSVECTSSIQHSRNSGVTIIDRNDIEELLKLISQYQIDLAKKHLLNLLEPQRQIGMTE